MRTTSGWYRTISQSLAELRLDLSIQEQTGGQWLEAKHPSTQFMSDSRLVLLFLIL